MIGSLTLLNQMKVGRQLSSLGLPHQHTLPSRWSQMFLVIIPLKGENAKLKKLLAEAHLDIHALKSVLGVKR